MLEMQLRISIKRNQSFRPPNPGGDLQWWVRREEKWEGEEVQSWRNRHHENECHSVPKYLAQPVTVGLYGGDHLEGVGPQELETFLQHCTRI